MRNTGREHISVRTEILDGIMDMSYKRGDDEQKFSKTSWAIIFIQNIIINIVVTSIKQGMLCTFSKKN